MFQLPTILQFNKNIESATYLIYPYYYEFITTLTFCITRCRNLPPEFQKTHKVKITTENSEIAPGLGSRVNALVSPTDYKQRTYF